MLVAWYKLDGDPYNSSLYRIGNAGLKTVTTTYTTPGQTALTIPPNVSRIRVWMWGGGGGGGTKGGWVCGAPGGGGAAAYGVVTVTPSGSYVVMVGGAGIANGTAYPAGGGGGYYTGGDNRYGATGGGLSGLFVTSYIQGNALLIAGGGGGGGSSRGGFGNKGGAGRSLVGQNGFSHYDSKWTYAGVGATQYAAGADASSDSANYSGGQGALQGGNRRTNCYGGAGGGGYWGSSAGGYSEANTMAGGGGGSSYLNPTYVQGELKSGIGITPGDVSNPKRGSAGEGGRPGTFDGSTGTQYNGTDGKVVIEWDVNDLEGSPTSITYTTGKIGQAAVFGGSSYITIVGFNGSAYMPYDVRNWDGNSTYCAWIYPTTLDATQRQIFSDSNQNEGMLAVYSDRIYMQFDTQGMFVTYYTALSTSTWYHLAMTHEKLYPASDLYRGTLFLNGVQVAQATTAYSNKASYYGPDGAMTIGWNWLGRLDDLRVYNHVLSTNEIRKLAQA